MEKLTIVLLLLISSFGAIAQETPKSHTYEWHLWQKKRRDAIKWLVKDSIKYEKKIPEGIIKYHYDYKTSGENKIFLPTYTELIRNDKSEILWDTSFIYRPQFGGGGIFRNNTFTFMASDGDSYYQFMVSVYNPISKKWGLKGSHKIGQSFNYNNGCFFIGANTLYRNVCCLNKVPQIFYINNYGELEVYNLSSYYPRDTTIALPTIDRERASIDILRRNDYRDIKKETSNANINPPPQNEHKTKALFNKKQVANNNNSNKSQGIQKDTVLLEKKLPEGTIRFHGSYSIAARGRKTKPTDTYIELLQDQETIILYDTSMFKLIGSIDKTDFMLFDNPYADEPYTFTFKTLPSNNNTDNNKAYAQLVSTVYDQQTKKWLLKGCHTYQVGSNNCQATVNHLLAVNTLLYYSPCDSLPKIYRLGKYGDLEVYQLNEIRLRDPKIPLPGIPNLAQIELLRQKNKEPYYGYLEQKNKIILPQLE